MKPFTIADIVKQCMLEAGNVLFGYRRDVESIRWIQLSASTHSRITHIWAEETYRDVKVQLHNCDY